MKLYKAASTQKRTNQYQDNGNRQRNYASMNFHSVNSLNRKANANQYFKIRQIRNERGDLSHGNDKTHLVAADRYDKISIQTNTNNPNANVTSKHALKDKGG